MADLSDHLHKFSMLFFTIWKVFTRIECSPVLHKEFLRSDSRSILVQLALLKLESEECEDLEYECVDCCTEGKSLLHSLLTKVANCLLNNKAKYLNISATCSKVNQRKYLKLCYKNYHNSKSRTMPQSYVFKIN